MKHFILGTSGHIDHGKTSLVRALTGRDTDRLREEKERGITIELGFTYYDDPSGIRIGIVDVPGHEKFIKNMVAGVHGMDAVMIVIAADEGMMPQTKEHLNILQLLGVQQGIVVLTKIDMVDHEWIDLVEEETREALAKTPFAASPILRVSARTGEGLDRLREVIGAYAAHVVERESTDQGILPIDRVFTLKGIGTVVTGTQVAGRFRAGDDVCIYPAGLETKIRSLQVHGVDMQESFSAQRVALNLQKLKKEDIERGSVLAYPDQLLVSDRIDVKFTLLEDSPYVLKNKARVRFHIASKETFARILLLDREEMLPGDIAYCQFRLEEQIAARRKDRFLVRFFSPVLTIGGGEILELTAHKKKRFRSEDLVTMEQKDNEDPVEVTLGILNDHRRDFLQVEDLSKVANLSEEILQSSLEELEDNGIVEMLTPQSPILRDTILHLASDVSDFLESYHKKYPLRGGITLEEMRSRFFQNVPQKLQDVLLRRICSEDDLKLDGDEVSRSNFTRVYSERDREGMESVLRTMAQENRLYARDAFPGVDPEILNAMVSDRQLIEIEGELYLYSDYLKARDILMDLFANSETVDAKAFRDALDTNRKTAIALLEHFDRKKITRRMGDARVLVKRGDIS